VTYFSLLFLYLILPLSILGYYLLPDMKRKNAMLILISLLLYSFGQPVCVVLMVGLSSLNYKMALRIDPEERGTLLLPLVLNLAVMMGLKYFALVLDLFAVDLGGFRILPLGMSVFTFSAVSYLLDVYNGTVEPEERFGNLLLYFLMFPRVLGPIVTYTQLRNQLNSRHSSPRGVFEGIQRFLFGLGKKVLLADACGRLIAAFEAAEADATLVGVWFTAILFLFRLYYDFSGCCDMALGLGRIFGFRYPENFNRPLTALSVTDFCGRWNVTLGRFFRNYIYEPLGGGEWGAFRQSVNMAICCVLLGLWYGTGINYILWAAFLWAVLTMELYLKNSMTFWPDWLCRCWTIWFLLLGMILFSHETMDGLKSAMGAILGYGGFSVAGTGRWILSSLPLLLICIIGSTNLPVYAKRIFAGVCGMDRRSAGDDRITLVRVLYSMVCLAVVLLLLWLGTIALTKQSALPAIYGKF